MEGLPYSCEEHYGFYGETRAGKTVAARYAVRDLDRLVVVDPKRKYDDMGSVKVSYEGCIDYLNRRAEDDTLRLVVGASEAPVRMAVVHYLWQLHATRELPPTCLLMDEAHTLYDGGRFPREPEAVVNDPDRGDPILALIYQEGLQERLVALTVTQYPQDLPTRVRGATRHVVAFRYGGTLTDDLARKFKGREEELERLDRLTPADLPPEKGRHYLTAPETLDPFTELADQING